MLSGLLLSVARITRTFALLKAAAMLTHHAREALLTHAM
jgi:hypothetical protein